VIAGVDLQQVSGAPYACLWAVRRGLEIAAASRAT